MIIIFVINKTKHSKITKQKFISFLSTSEKHT